MTEQNSMERLPCGCNAGTDVIDGVNTFIIEPCDLECEFYLYALEVSRAQGNKETVIDAR